MTYEASAVSDAVGSDRDDALRTRMMRYTVAAMFFVGFLALLLLEEVIG